MKKKWLISFYIQIFTHSFFCYYVNTLVFFGCLLFLHSSCLFFLSFPFLFQYLIWDCRTKCDKFTGNLQLGLAASADELTAWQGCADGPGSSHMTYDVILVSPVTSKAFCFLMNVIFTCLGNPFFAACFMYLFFPLWIWYLFLIISTSQKIRKRKNYACNSLCFCIDFILCCVMVHL